MTPTGAASARSGRRVMAQTAEDLELDRHVRRKSGVVRSAACSLSAEAAWSSLASLGQTLADGTDGAIERALDSLASTLGADRVFILCGAHAEHVRCGRRAGRNARPDEQGDVCREVIEDALASGGTAEMADDLGRDDRVTELGIIAAIAAPLPKARGLLYADFRHPLRRPSRPHRDLLSFAAALIAPALWSSEPTAPSAPCRAPTELDLNDLLETTGLRELRPEIEASLRVDAPTLIIGESGTGKTLLAGALARASEREPVVRAMLGASDDLNTIASELFGHERGAFSGAVGRRSGLVELAEGGTLILDEVLNLPMRAQQLLLDLTQFGTYRPLGWQGREPKRANVRIVAATNGDLERAVAEGSFRRDLYYRLAGTVIRMPALRERRGDVPGLALTCLRRLDPTRRWALSVDARRMLRSPALDWPGNVRELELVLARATARARGLDPRATQLRPEHFDAAYGGVRLDRDGIDTDSLDLEPGGSLGETWRRIASERGSLERAERRLLERAVRENDGVLAHAARALQIPRTTLISRLARAGIRTPTLRRER